MVSRPGNAPSISPARAARIAFFLAAEKVGDPDGCCPRYLRLDRAASLLFLFRVELVGDGGNAPLVVFRPCLTTAGLQSAGRNITRQCWRAKPKLALRAKAGVRRIRTVNCVVRGRDDPLS